MGKTLLTALLLAHLRQEKVSALAMKPFCSGGRGDVQLIQSLQPGALTDEMANPFYFSEPIAPLVAAKEVGRRIFLRDVLQKIRRVRKRCDILLIEGSGGLMVPLGDGFLVIDLLKKLKCEVVLVARNQLGTINHTLLSVGALQTAGVKKVTVVVSTGKTRDPSTETNEKVIEKLLGKARVLSVPFLGDRVLKPVAIKKGAKKIKKTLARIVGRD